MLNLKTGINGAYYKNGKGKYPRKVRIGNVIIKDQWESQEKIGGRCPEGHVTHPRNMRMEEPSRTRRRMEASSDGGQGPEGAVAQFIRWLYSHCIRLFFCLSFFVDVTFLRSNF